MPAAPPADRKSPPAAGAPAHEGTTRRISLVMWLGGIFGLLSAVLGPDPDTSDHATFLALTVVAVAAIAATLLRPQFGVRTLTATVTLMSATIWVCVAVARPTNGVPLYSIWPILLAAYGLPRRAFAGVLAANVVGLAVAILGFVPPPARGLLWLETTITVVAAGLVFRSLRERVTALVARLEEVAGRLHDAGRRDPLTGLANRRAFDEALERELQRAERAGRACSLVLVDVDHFKDINDRHGHAQGDAALQLLAAEAQRALRPGDVLARIGGEEFAVVLFGADAEEARAVAERLAGAVRAAAAGTPAPFTVSAGVATRAPGRETAEALLVAADDALYAAKEGGRRRIGVAGEHEPGPEVPARPLAPSSATLPAGVADAEPLPAVGYADDDLPLAQRVAAGMCAVAALAMPGGLLVPDVTSVDVLTTVAFTLTTLVTGLWLWHGRQQPAIVLQAFSYVVVVLVGIAVATIDPLVSAPYFYLWPAVYAAYFFSRRHLVAVLLFTAATYGVALWQWVDAPLRTSDWSTVLAPVAIAALAVAVQRDRVRELLDELRGRLAELEHAATHDGLTGLLNRRTFDVLLAREVRRAHDTGLALSLVVLDVDHFKALNDREGHAAGDEALRRLAATVTDRVRAGDLVARLGGEEFAVLLLGAGAAAAADLADVVGATLLAPGHGTRLAVSAGVAQLSPGVADTDALMLAADRALYAAKAAGRGRSAIWGEPPLVRPPLHVRAVA